MAEVPREAVEFARMVTRAFYPPDYVVAIDGVLRGNNYCAHNELAHRLKIAPKELRVTLVKMAHARLVTCEKRVQKRINFRDERRPSRSVNTEFWYVPLRQVIEAFTFRVYKISAELDGIIAQHAAERRYRCERCETVYNELDVVALLAPDGSGFICERYGMHTSRRPGECGGAITEENNTTQLKETEALKRRLDTQLQPLRERAEKCMHLEIPAHPLEGADEETWGDIVPENIGIHGEKVDEDGFTPEIAAEVRGLKDAQVQKEEANEIALAAFGKPPVEDESAIPDKPSWFKDSAAVDEDADDDWDDESAQQNILKTTTGTAATFGDAGDAKSYYEHFLRQAGGVAEEPEAAALLTRVDGIVEPESAKRAVETARLNAEESAVLMDLSPSAAAPEEEAFVKVGGKSVKLSEVTEEMKEEMTPEEYEAYFALARSGDDDDDDDEFE